jgi:coenzyme Q-binding protein COQ10
LRNSAFKFNAHEVNQNVLKLQSLPQQDLVNSIRHYRTSTHLVFDRTCCKRRRFTNCLKNYQSGTHLFQTTAAKDFLSLPGFPEVKEKEFAERRIVGFTMDQMYDVVSDVDHYVNFLPWCDSSTVKSKSSTVIVADLVIGMKPVTESYTSVVTMKRPHFVKAESKDGGRHFSHMTTNWKFSPGLKGLPQSCLIDFYVSFKFRSALHSQVGNIFFNQVVKAMANAFYKEAQHRYGKESIPSRRVALITRPAQSPAANTKANAKGDEDNLP